MYLSLSGYNNPNDIVSCFEVSVLPVFRTFDEIKQEVKQKKPLIISVAQAANHDVLYSVKEAYEQNMASFLLFGDKHEISRMADEIGLSLDPHQLFHAASDEEACQQAVFAVQQKRADIVMKGLVHSSLFLKAVLDREKGLRAGKRLSHVVTFEVAGYDRLLHLTDASFNIAPTWDEKVQLIENVAEYCHLLGVSSPKIALLGAIEVVNPHMQATVDAAILTQMNRRGQLANMMIDGPFALDNAISKRSAKLKKIDSEVAGQADVLVVPDIEAGNILYKSLTYFARAKMGALVLGAKAPVILTSRADSVETKLNSIALAILQTD